MTQLRLHLTTPPRFERSPELAPLEILDAALEVSQTALLAAHVELAHGDIDDSTRGSCAMRANAVIVQARRLAAALAAYREAVDRDTRRAARERCRLPF